MQKTIAEWNALATNYPETEIAFTPVEARSWRGSYDEPCIVLKEGKSTAGEMLKFLEQLTNEKFYGWKGGKYYYDTSQSLNFEFYPGGYTEDQDNLTSELLGIAENEDTEIVELLFSKMEYDGYGYWLPNIMLDTKEVKTLENFRKLLIEKLKD